MQNVAWRKALEKSADPQRAEHYVELLRGTEAGSRLRKSKGDQIGIFATVLGASQALGELLVAHPDWTAQLEPSLLQKRRWKEGLEREVRSWFNPLLEGQKFPQASARLREFKSKEMLRIAARDLVRFGDVTEITQEISDVADVCLDAVCDLCWQQLASGSGSRFTRTPAALAARLQFSVIGLGKLGGQELNYSSDVDVVLVYTEEGSTFKEPPRKAETAGRGLSNHQFFLRLAEAFIAEVTRLTPEGSLFRIDFAAAPGRESRARWRGRWPATRTTTRNGARRGSG